MTFKGIFQCLLFSLSVLGGTGMCTIPKFVSDWESYQRYPTPIGESQGVLLNTSDFIIFSGFSMAFTNTTMQTFSLNLQKPIASLGGKWIEQDPIPISPGLSRAALATINNNSTNQVVYLCGGYVGGSPYPATDKCFSYTHNAPKGMQWNNITSLPQPRAGGGMWYNSVTKSLIFAAGASRPIPTNLKFVIDHNDTWELFLDNTQAGWQPRPSLRYRSNHVGHITVNYLGLGERHYIAGGQRAGDERYGNLDEVTEYVPATQQWIPRQPLPFKRGHFSSSVINYEDCGFLIVAGAINTTNGVYERTSDISYYDIGTNTWTSIGNFTIPIATPVCTLHSDYLYCQTGRVKSYVSVRRKLI